MASTRPSTASTNTVGKVTSGAGNTVSSATNGVVDPTKTVSTVNKVVGGVGNGVANTGSQVVNGATDAATGAVGQGGLRAHRRVARGQERARERVRLVRVHPGATSTPKTPPAPAAANGSGNASPPIASGLKQVGGLLGR